MMFSLRVEMFVSDADVTACGIKLSEGMCSLAARAGSKVKLRKKVE